MNNIMKKSIQAVMW